MSITSNIGKFISAYPYLKAKGHSRTHRVGDPPSYLIGREIRSPWANWDKDCIKTVTKTCETCGG